MFHPSGEPNTPLLVELRSQHYARYDTERKLDQRPPFAADDPMIDLITISDRYANGAPPPAPSDCANGGKEVVNAAAEGKRAALAIHADLTAP